LLEKETLHRADLAAIFANVRKRPRLTVFDDFGGRVPSDKPPIKTPGELAIERGEPWPRPIPEPAFKKAIAQASAEAQGQHGAVVNGNGSHGGYSGGGRHEAEDTAVLPEYNNGPAGPDYNNGPAGPDYGAPAGWRAPGWPPPPNQGQWYPAPPGWGHHQPQHQQHGQQPYPPYQPYPAPTPPAYPENPGDQAEPGDHSR
jgi:cell division protease FtsH